MTQNGELLPCVARDRTDRRCSARRLRPPLARRPIRRSDSERGNVDDARIGRATVDHHSDYFGYDVARTPNDDSVADAHVFALQLVHVVQRRVADRDAADEHGLEARDRRERASASHLKLDVANYA